MQGIGVARDTSCRCNCERVTCRYDAIFGDGVWRNYQSVAIHTANILLDMEVFQVIFHVSFVAVDAQVIWHFEQLLLAVWIVAVYATHIGGGMPSQAPFMQSRRMTGTTIISVGTNRDDCRGVVRIDYPVTGLARDPLNVESVRSSLVIGCM